MYTSRSEHRSTLHVLLAAIGFTLMIGQAAAQESDATALTDRASTPRTVDQLRDLQERVRALVAQARQATVTIEQDDSIGSGVIVSPDGLILSAGHVCVEPNREVWVRFADDTRVRGLTLGVNHELDSGMARITEPAPTEGGWPALKISESPVEPGEWVVALGQPNGFFVDRAPPVRLGRVLSYDEESITTDATLVGGDSGGPLLNLLGEVVATHSRIGERLTSNFHVPVNVFQGEWDRLVDGRMTGLPDGEDPQESRPLAGIAVRFHGGECVVTQVFPGSAADEAGVRAGDVITRCGTTQPADAPSLSAYMMQQNAYDRLPLALRRGDQTLEVELWLGRAARRFPGGEPDTSTATR